MSADIHNLKTVENIADWEMSLKLLQSDVRTVKTDLSDEQLTRVSDLITAYENIDEGN